MSSAIRWLGVLGCLMGAVAFGDFTKPALEQLQAAAENPAQLGALLRDASPDQAAETAKDVIIEIIQLDLKPEERDARAASLMDQLFLAMPTDTWPALAISFGRFVAASPAATMSPSLLSAIHQAIIRVGDVDLGEAFGNAFNLAMQTVAGKPAGGKTVPPQPPPPPVALPREGTPPGPPPGPPPRPPRPPVPPPYEGQSLN
ncbi:MAG TPA: hypothetical protein PL039_00125 [Kiritimatiellia bacterium]|nr:hypothetical protein [Kiritimatiellia bacterium]HQQ61015.1 hypothetical protein [Kiritimatiellia bacterium]